MTTDTTPDTPTVVDAGDALALQAGKAQAFDALTVRDFFAAHALAGYLAAHAGDETALPGRAEAAKNSYKLADEMLKARRTSA